MTPWKSRPANPVASGVAHDVPPDLKNALLADREALALWEAITPLARNEWLCWIEDAKRESTRLKRIERVSADLKKGKRRPCCWPGCSHRT
jgi:uncharacterized protein YdeI (YjbR/CyaY-like superfamily)